MRGRCVLVWLPVALLAACGSSGDGAALWCPAVPQLTRDVTTDRTGRDNTFSRVRRIHERYADALFDACPGVTSVGIGKTRPSAAVNNPAVPSRRAKRLSDREPDHLLSVGVRSDDDRPESPLYLDGARLEFHVTGEIQAAPSGAG